MNKITKQIIRNIIYAQAASDGGKYIKFVPDKRRHSATAFANVCGYSQKERFIIDALMLCDKSKTTDVKYYVKVTPDQNGYKSVLVYFNVNVDGIKGQVSFHNPYHRASDILKKYIGKGRSCEWDHGSSRAVCATLAEQVF